MWENQSAQQLQGMHSAKSASMCGSKKQSHSWKEKKWNLKSSTSEHTPLWDMVEAALCCEVGFSSVGAGKLVRVEVEVDKVKKREILQETLLRLQKSRR